MKAKDVNPENWQWDKDYPIRVLYDDGDYSIIWGKYKNDKALGARWNGDDDSERGYPGQGAYPTWHVEPDFIATSILQRLYTKAIDSNETTYLEEIKFAINELQSKVLSEPVETREVLKAIDISNGHAISKEIRNHVSPRTNVKWSGEILTEKEYGEKKKENSALKNLYLVKGDFGYLGALLPELQALGVMINLENVNPEKHHLYKIIRLHSS